MFITNESHRSPIPALFGDPGRELWFTVELALQKLWFLVSFTEFENESHDSFSVCRTIFVDRVESVMQLIQLNNAGLIEFQVVQIITPGHMNGTNHWKMELLESVLTAKEPDADCQNVHVFVTRDGVRYSDTMLETAISDLLFGDVLYSFPGSYNR